MGPSFQAKMAAYQSFGLRFSALTSPLARIVQAQKVLHDQMEPVRKTMELIQSRFRVLAEVLEIFRETIIKPIVYAFGWKPLIYVPNPPIELVPDKRLDRHLSLEVDTYGFFIIGGKKLYRIHSRSSRIGRFLHALMIRRAEIVPYEDIKIEIGAGDRTKAFKDLKYKLRQEGYLLDYVLVRGEGIALKGILAI